MTNSFRHSLHQKTISYTNSFTTVTVCMTMIVILRLQPVRYSRQRRHVVHRRQEGTSERELWPPQRYLVPSGALSSTRGTVMPPLFRLRHALTTRRGCSTTAECCLLMGTEGYRTGCSGCAPWYLDLELSSTGGRAMPSMARLHHTSRTLSTLSLQSIVILSMNMM